MYRGETGERVEGTLFFGCAHYNRVKQMVEDKHHARARGPVHVLTEQPLEGRAKDGGFRVGDMERDAIVSHGAAGVAEDRLLHQSDYARVPVCVTCGSVAMGRAPPDQRSWVMGRNEHGGYCWACKEAGAVHTVPMPFAAKLLAAEMGAANLRVSFRVDAQSGLDPSTTAAVGLKRADPEAERALLRPTVQPRRGGGIRDWARAAGRPGRPWRQTAHDGWVGLQEGEEDEEEEGGDHLDGLPPGFLAAATAATVGPVGEDEEEEDPSELVGLTHGLLPPGFS